MISLTLGWFANFFNATDWLDNTLKVYKKYQSKISVIGIGGAGGNAVNTMISEKTENIDFMASEAKWEKGCVPQ